MVRVMMCSSCIRDAESNEILKYFLVMFYLPITADKKNHLHYDQEILNILEFLIIHINTQKLGFLHFLHFIPMEMTVLMQYFANNMLTHLKISLLITRLLYDSLNIFKENTISAPFFNKSNLS